MASYFVRNHVREVLQHYRSSRKVRGVLDNIIQVKQYFSLGNFSGEIHQTNNKEILSSNTSSIRSLAMCHTTCSVYSVRLKNLFEL